MRFKARVTNVPQLTRVFLHVNSIHVDVCPGVIQTLDKLHKVCTLLITPQQFMFVIRADVIVWAGLSVVYTVILLFS